MGSHAERTSKPRVQPPAHLVYVLEVNGSKGWEVVDEDAHYLDRAIERVRELRRAMIDSQGIYRDEADELEGVRLTLEWRSGL